LPRVRTVSAWNGGASAAARSFRASSDR
jgi:hypothetical protein